LVESSRGSSPWAAAMSAMERSITVVEMGSSIVSAGSPRAPPAAPEAATASRWMRLLAVVALCVPSDFTATSRALSSADWVAWCTADCHEDGSSFMPWSMGAPASAESFAAMPGCSRMSFARLSSTRSSGVRPVNTWIGSWAMTYRQRRTAGVPR